MVQIGWFICPRAVVDIALLLYGVLFFERWFVFWIGVAFDEGVAFTGSEEVGLVFEGLGASHVVHRSSKI